MGKLEQDFISFVNYMISSLDVKSLTRMIVKFALKEKLPESSIRQLIQEYTKLEKTQKRKILIVYRFCKNNSFVDIDVLESLGLEKIYEITKEPDVNRQKDLLIATINNKLSVRALKKLRDEGK